MNNQTKKGNCMGNEIIRSVFDLETTNLDHELGGIVEICILPFDDQLNIREDIPAFHTFVAPEHDCVIDPLAMKINGIKQDQMRVFTWKRQVIQELFDWKEKYNIKKIDGLGQNMKFDLDFYKEFTKGISSLSGLFDHTYADTKFVAKGINDAFLAKGKPKPFKNLKLETLAAYFDIDYSNAHSAFEDCKITLQVYRCLLGVW
jgi:DNA polymerase III epsilon subunit-like protein